MQSPIEKPAKVKRASRPKVRSGCITCKNRRVKCDEGKPACTRCIQSGRQCEGYTRPRSSIVVPRMLAPAPKVESSVEVQGLETFFHRTAPQLATYFESALFRGRALQLSLTEPVIRHAVAALGLLHGQAGLGKLRPGESRPLSRSAIQLYNRSIRCLLDRTVTTLDSNGLPVLALANILFTCFEYFQGNRVMATSHVQGGIAILRTWRQSHGGDPTQPWGRKYDSMDTRFLETEIVPLLSAFNTTQSILSSFSIAGLSQNRHSHGRSLQLQSVFLNPIDEHGRVAFADRFEALHDAKAALIDLVTSAVWQHRDADLGFERGKPPGAHVSRVSNDTQAALDRWQANFEDLAERRSAQWAERRVQMTKTIKIMKLCVEFGRIYAQTSRECDWDTHRAKYESLLEVVEDLISTNGRDKSDGTSGTMCMDFGMIFPLHTATWKCRWPLLRRRGIGILIRLAKREWLWDMEYFNAIFIRVMEMEEASLNLAPGTVPDGDWLPPEHVRIHHFRVTGHIRTPGRTTACDVTFYSKPHGLDGPWHAVTETIRPLI